MRCRACNREHDPLQLLRTVEGQVVMEDLCGECLFWARAAVYDGGPDGELEYLTVTLGIGGYNGMDQEGGI